MKWELMVWLLAWEVMETTSSREKRENRFPFLTRPERQEDGGMGACMAWLVKGLLSPRNHDAQATQTQDLAAVLGIPPHVLQNLSPEEKQALRYMQILQQVERKRLGEVRAAELKERPVKEEAKKPLLSQFFDFLGVDKDDDKKKIVIDTGKNFDRFVVHERRGLDAFGVPLYDNLQSTGVMWGDGDIRFVNSDSNGLLGATVRQRDNGFIIPLHSLRRRSRPVSPLPHRPGQRPVIPATLIRAPPPPPPLPSLQRRQPR